MYGRNKIDQNLSESRAYPEQKVLRKSFKCRKDYDSFMFGLQHK